MIERDVRWLVGQCLMIGLPGPELDYESSALIARHLINNVILFRHNAPDPVSTRRLTDELQSFAKVETGVPMLIAADQEGGRVQRLVNGATRLPSAMLMGRAGPGHVRAVAEIAGRELLASGVNMVLAPVADVNNNPLNPVIGVRSFGEDPVAVAACVTAAVEGYHSAGIVCCAKHFPGHGDTEADSHLLMPTVAAPTTVIERRELPPFEAAIAAGVDAVMTGHLSMPAIDDSRRPATLSTPLTTGLLRRRLGFEGLVCTDSMEMGGVVHHHPDFGEVAVRAFEAGNDLIAVPHSVARCEAAVTGILEAVAAGRITLDRLRLSATRVAAARDRARVPKEAGGLDLAHHAETVERAVRAGVRVTSRPDLLPLRGRIGVTSYDSGGATGAEEARQRDDDPFVAAAARRGAISRRPGETLAVDSLLIGVHRPSPGQITLLEGLARERAGMAVVCLREPYALAGLRDKVAVVEACDDGPFAIEAALDRVLGVG
ncbi:MAG TPA: glycoside hydrolase family 3 N-terminal domain-containing protein [Candidatus Dormibacteraeota bacterium]|jgi:beta-N-acetylhexosaminidase|nr:glycoside hydrolase family 3 N-terminal domain-containing protein [Candidatus Dormibacteraeota bacterium]